MCLSRSGSSTNACAALLAHFPASHAVRSSTFGLSAGIWADTAAAVCPCSEVRRLTVAAYDWGVIQLENDDKELRLRPYMSMQVWTHMKRMPSDVARRVAMPGCRKTNPTTT